MALKWYVVHVYSGFENKVKAALEEKISAFPHPEKFGGIVVPTEQVVELVKALNFSLEKLRMTVPSLSIVIPTNAPEA